MLAKMYNDAAAVGNSVAVSQEKLNIESPDNPVIPLLGIYPQGTESMDSDICTLTFIAASFIKSQVLLGFTNPTLPSQSKVFKSRCTDDVEARRNFLILNSK